MHTAKNGTSQTTQSIFESGKRRNNLAEIPALDAALRFNQSVLSNDDPSVQMYNLWYLVAGKENTEKWPVKSGGKAGWPKPKKS